MNDDLPPLPEPAYLADDMHAFPAGTVAKWPQPNRHRMAHPLYTAAQVEEIRRAAVLAERLATLEAVNALIKDGPFKGNGYDDLAQNNGVILAANLLASRVYAIRKGTT